MSACKSEAGASWVNGMLAWGLGGIACMLIGAGDIQAQTHLGTAARSSSGQFLATTKGPGRTTRVVQLLSTNAAFVRLQPATLVVSAERIKQVLYRELQINPQWRAKIFLSIRPALSGNEEVLLGCERYRDGWQYGLDLPEYIERSRLVRAMTQCLLLELANWTSRERSAEIPDWLSEGLAAHLLASEAELIVTPPTQGGGLRDLARAVSVSRRENPLAKAHTVLSRGEALTFQELSFPAPELLQRPKVELYSSSAQLFVSELLRLEKGPESLFQMVSSLPEFYNWQFAFLRSFHPWFKRPLDVEKWWELKLAHFTGRQLASTWEDNESWLKLDEALTANVEIRVNTNDLPRQARLTLQSIVLEWEKPDQATVLRQKISNLNALRLRVSPEIAVFIDDYAKALYSYMSERKLAEADHRLRNPINLRRIAMNAVRELDALDLRRTVQRAARQQALK